MIVLASDHGGFVLKKPVIAVLEELGLPWTDIGTDGEAATDYPVWGYRAAQMVARGECERGLVFCGTGIGISLAANKVRGIRCAVCSDCFSAQMSRAHNDANMLAMGGRVVGPDLARMIARVWLTTPFEGGGRHTKRVAMLTAVEEGREP